MTKIHLTMIYEGEYRGLGLDGKELPRAGPLKIALIIPERMIDGPFRELKMWFIDQYNKRYHHTPPPPSSSNTCTAGAADSNTGVILKKNKQKKLQKGPPKFHAKDCRFVRKDGSGVYDVDTISRSIKDHMKIWLVMGGERDAGKEDKYKESKLVGAASASIYAIRRQRATEKASEMDKLYEAHAKMIAAQDDVEGIILKRAAVARAHKAYSPRLTELTTLGLLGEVRAFLRDEACDPKKAVSETYINEDNDTPLALACMFGHREIVTELLKYGADPDQPSGVDDWTPLVHASRCCQHEIVKDLLKAGADRSRLNKNDTVWGGDHVLAHSFRGIGRTDEDRFKTTKLIQTYDVAESWIEVIDQHWAEVKAGREKRGETDDPAKEFRRLAAIESHNNTKGRNPRYLPYKDPTELVQTKTISPDQLDRLVKIWKLIATARQEDDAPQDGVVEGEKEPIMSKTRLLAALVDRKRNNRIRSLLTGGYEGGADNDVDENSTLPSLMVLLKPNLWKEAFLQMDSRLGAGKISFDEFIAFVLVSDSPSGAGRATLRQIFDTLDPYQSDKINRKDLLKALMGVKDHKSTRSNNWAIRMIYEIPSLRPLLKPSSWAVLFPQRKIKTEEELKIEYEQKYENISLRDEKLEKIKKLYGTNKDEGKNDSHIERKSIDERLDTLSFSDFFDRAHKVCSEIGKFLPYKDDSMLREERISDPGDKVYARWKSSREYYPATIIFCNPPLYSVSYESGEYDAHVNIQDIIYPDEWTELQSGDPEFRTGK